MPTGLTARLMAQAPMGTSCKTGSKKVNMSSVRLLINNKHLANSNRFYCY